MTDRLKRLKTLYVRSLDPARTSAAKRSAFWVNHPALVYSLVLTLLGAVIAFGLVGISVARDSETTLPYIWVPRLLIIACGVLIATTLHRLIRRLSR